MTSYSNAIARVRYEQNQSLIHNVIAWKINETGPARQMGNPFQNNRLLHYGRGDEINNTFVF